MLTRLQSKALESSAVEAPQPDSGTLNDVEPSPPALVLDPVGSVHEADDKSISGTSKSSSTIRARSLNIKALYARKAAEAEAKAAEVERKRAAKVVEAERRALEMEMRAEIAQIEAEGSSRRGSSRASSRRDNSRANSHRGSSRLSRGNVVEWLDTMTPSNECVFVDTRGATTVDAPGTVRPGSPTLAVPTSALIEGRPVAAATADAPVIVRSGSPTLPVAAFNLRVPAPAGRGVTCDPSAGPSRLALDPTPPRPCCGPTGDVQDSTCLRTLPTNISSNQNGSDFNRLAQAIQSLSKDKMQSRLPSFDGKTLDWLAFKRAYDASKASYSSMENLSRVNAALYGPAREAVGALLSTANNPGDIISVLELQFGRPELIVLQEVAAVRALPKVNFEGKDLHFFAGRVRSCIAVMKYLDNKSYLESPELYNSLLLKLTPAMRARWKDYAKSRFNPIVGTKLELLADFLVEEVTTEFQFGVISEANLLSQPTSRQPTFRQPTFRTAVVDSSPNTYTSKASVNKNHPQISISCLYCHKSHIIDNCDKFIHLDFMARLNWAREQKVCNRCLKKGSHRYRSCNPKTLCNVEGCKYKHHKLLHNYESVNSHTTTETLSNGIEPEPSCSTMPIESKSETVAHAISNGPLKALLKVVAVTVSGPKGSINTYALLDDGSSSTFIDDEVSAHIGAVGPKAQIRVECMGGLSKLTEVEYVDFYIKGVHESKQHKIYRARSVSALGIARQSVSPDDIRHLSLANITYDNAEPKLIIGIDNWNLLTPREVRQGSKRQPAACLTPLGWAVIGFTSSRTKPVTFVNHSTTSDDFSEIEGLIKDNFKLESIGIVKQRVRSAADERASKILEDTARRLPGGQFEVGLLWQSDVTDIPDSYPLAFSRFNGLEKRFRKDAAYAQQYRENIHAMIDKGYAEPCDISSDSTRLWYLPHFGVVNPNKPGKLRVVHDAAARSQGVSLNSLLLTGPDLLPSLLNIIYRFREGRIGMIADVKEMFPQVKIRPEDRDAQRFLWRDSPDLPLSTYRMSSMIFGAASSPFTALYLKNKNAEEFRDLYPEAAHAIIHDTYMDDFIGSLEGSDEAAQLARDIVEVQERADFEVRGWVSNEPDALTLIPQNLRLDSGSTGVDIGHFPQSVRTLGLIWYPSTDELGFNTAALKTSLALPQKITKRHALSSMMRVFDPLGVLAPITIKARIIFQVVWRRGIDWDQEFPQDLSTKWKAWLADVSSAVDIRVPRWHLREAHVPNQAHLIERELHVFCDASEHAYVAVAYWRLVLPDKTVQVSFICSKSRVAPLTPVTISRLELQAATVAARLATSICDAHKFKPSRRFLWTDSKNVLGWLRSDARSFLPFVAHRLADILELSSLDEWRWVPTALNVADDATRQKSDADLKNSRWIEGPEFLKSPQYDWPVEPHNTSLNKDELKPSAKIHSYLIQVGTIPVHPVSADPSRFSQWLRFLRSTARAHQYIRRLRCRANAKASTSHTPASRLRTSVAQLTPLTAEDLRLAQLHILIKCQNDSFPDELAALRLGEPLPRHSKLQKLHVILGSDGLMTLSGRIGAVAESTEATNFPIVLDGSHPAVKLLTHYYHRRFAHGNNETVVNELRQQFWILKLRSTVRAAAHACQYCKIRKAIPLNPPVGNLPAVRLAHHRRPFTFVGLDYFGPVQITVGRRHEKRWVALFTCLTTRAVHLEVVHDLSTDAALMALRRFTARRGSPQQIWSDNGTAFVGAAKFMRELYGPAVQEFATNQNIDWIFIPPSAPSMGGAWERLVRSVKSALKVTLQERAPKEPVLTTLLMEAEAVVNSRPLTYIPTDSNDEEALTPFHFLIGTASTANHYGKTEPQDLWSRSLWRKALRLTDLFWNRWVREYLPTLTPRRGDRTGDGLALGVGDLVLVVDGNLPRGTWPRGRITRVFPGADGLVRVAEVSTAGGVLRRPCKKLVRLPV
ncbi:hypothetical protein ABMA27_001036 [Loxostege sticticalis]|uniref:Integrase catalytic domain-containing protein n=1 Tax=Loxostege sticticalis TaxID=481309 RepID=A0ABR3I1A5_LOXSC